MQDLILIILFLIVAGVISLVKWHVEKAQRESREGGAESHRPTAPSPPYARPAAPSLPQARRPAQPGYAPARPGQPRPTPMPPGLRQAPARGPVARPVPLRPAHPQPPPLVEAVLVEEAAPVGPVAALGSRHPERLRTAKVSSLAGHRLEGTQLAAQAGPAAVRPRGRAGYVADLVRGPNLARAFVLSEVFGPPKGLEGP